MRGWSRPKQQKKHFGQNTCSVADAKALLNQWCKQKNQCFLLLCFVTGRFAMVMCVKVTCALCRLL